MISTELALIVGVCSTALYSLQHMNDSTNTTREIEMTVSEYDDVHNNDIIEHMTSGYGTGSMNALSSSNDVENGTLLTKIPSPPQPVAATTPETKVNTLTSAVAGSSGITLPMLNSAAMEYKITSSLGLKNRGGDIWRDALEIPSANCHQNVSEYLATSEGIGSFRYNSKGGGVGLGTSTFI